MLHSFTAAAPASRTPEQVVRQLDRAFEVLVECVNRDSRMVDSFSATDFCALFARRSRIRAPGAGR